MLCWYLTADLLFSSRVTSMAEQMGRKIELLTLPAAVDALLNDPDAASPNLVIIDLSMPGLELAALIPRFREIPSSPKIIAYGPHVHAPKLAAAEAAGCDVVMSNGEFSSKIGEILR
jgi:DNA-binding NarL/FixJ family response regulator